MKRLGIIQPGKIGDIIICLPIAKWYANKGYEVIWPLDKNIINNFLGYIDYVTFVPIDFDCFAAHQVCYNTGCNKIIDLAFCVPNANPFNTESYIKQDIYSFDAYKYFIADVPFEEKWNLKINRNLEREQKLLQSLNKDLYILVQDTSSDFNRPVSINDYSAATRIDIDRRTESVFDWIGAMEKAQQLILIESCFSNLADQLSIKTNKHVLLLKHGYYGSMLKDSRLKGVPVLKLNWEKI
jgi:hypothetical protein